MAQATDGSPLIVAANNTATGQTVLNRSNSTAGTALEVDNNNGDAIYATALNGRGVYANTVNGTSAAMEANSSTVGITVIAGGHGVSSQTTATTASGAASLFGYSWGSVTPPNSTYAVRGDSMGYVGVRGNSGFSLGAMYPGAASIGVLGVSDPNDSRALATPAQPAGVYGLSNSSVAGVVGQSNGGNGVYGASTSNVGVLGTSTSSHGLYGASTNGYGVYATSTNSAGVVASANSGVGVQGTSNGNVGVLGTSSSSIGGYFSSTSATGLYASGPAAGYAARFDGPVLVNGNFTAMGGSKSAAVPHPDGSHRRLYCVESPESWFEDFGQDQLVNGRARVSLDRDFAALVQGDHYQVFLTLKGDCNGLYVSDQSPAGFEVRELKGGTSNAPFNYRVVAKRKDIPGVRLEKVDVPAVPQRPAAPLPPPTITPLPAPAIHPEDTPQPPGHHGR